MALPVRIAAPVPQVQLTTGRLLDVINEIQFEGVTNGDADVDLRWLQGITWRPEPTHALYGSDVDVCTRIDYTATPRLCDPWITQTAFSVYDAFKAASLEFTPEEAQAIIEGRVTRKVSAAFAKELLDGAISGDRSLSNQAHPPFLRAFASAATPIWYCLSVLEDDLARTLRGQAGMIHMPPGLLAQAVESYELIRGDDGQYRTPLGHQVVADAGYVDAIAPGGNAASAASTEWVYASGPVLYRRSAVRMVDGGNIGSTMTTYTGREDLRSADYVGFRTHDDMTRYADVFGIFQFDPAPVSACLASYEVTDVV